MTYELLQKDFSSDEAEALQKKYSLILKKKSQKSVINTIIKDIEWVVGVLNLIYGLYF